MTCDAATLKPLSVCLECLSPKQLRSQIAYLTCQYANKTPPDDDMKIKATTLDNFALVNDSVDYVLFPNLTAITTSGEINFTLCPAQVLLDLRNLTTINGGTFTINQCVNMTTINLSSLNETLGGTGTGWQVSSNPLLSSIVFNPSVLFMDDSSTWIFVNNALNGVTINFLLARFLASGVTTLIIDLTGGTNAPPSGQGILDKAALILLGNQVFTN